MGWEPTVNEWDQELFRKDDWEHFEPSELPSPAFVVGTQPLIRNLTLLKEVQRESGAKILLALKGFAFWPLAKLISSYLSGTTASGLNELELGHQEFGGESTVYSPAYSPKEIPKILELAHHMIFNSPGEWMRYRHLFHDAGAPKAGIRVNPLYSEVKTRLYDPCAPYSRLGTPPETFDPSQLEGINGLHFHTLCEQNATTLSNTLIHVEKHFGAFIKDHCQWVNFGGGHHITKAHYDRSLLIELVKDFSNKYGVEIFLEPGEAVAIQSGILVSTVLDITHNGMPLAILDTSATCHMPDVLEMPYRPDILGADLPGKTSHTYRLGGQSCLAGDVIGDYSFKKPLEVGDRLIFLDMAHYTMVKTTTFNGIPLPSLATWDQEAKKLQVHRQFTYQDYKNRLG